MENIVNNSTIYLVNFLLIVFIFACNIKIIFMMFVVIGSSASLGSVVDFSDMMILAMAFPNIIGLLIMSNEVKLDLASYLKKIKDGTIKKYK